MFLRIISFRWGEAFPNYFDPTSWHRHEVLLGYGVALRLVGWYDIRVWRTSLLWVLHLCYDWIVVGYALTALSKYSLILPFLATHAFSAGGISLVTLGMMARVSLGHSGRPLLPPRMTALAFALLCLISPHCCVLWRLYFLFTITEAGFFFPEVFGLLAFLFFLWDYFPMLIAPKID